VLYVGVRGDELRAVDALFEHSIDGVAARAATAHDGDVRLEIVEDLLEFLVGHRARSVGLVATVPHRGPLALVVLAGVRRGVGGQPLVDEAHRQAKASLAPPRAADPSAPADFPAGTFTKDSEHATLVSDIIAGKNGAHVGVAPDASLYVGNADSLTGIKSAVDWLERGGDANGAYDVSIFNHSWQGGDADAAQFMDWMTIERDTLHVIAAGNSSGPLDGVATAFNGLTVGALDGAFEARGLFSDFEPGATPKPDLVAPGTDIANGPAGPGQIEDTGTSFAAPQVTGVAAMLAEKGLTVGSGNAKNRLAQRAIIMNSTRKRHINPPDAANAVAKDNAATVGKSSAAAGGGAVTHDGNYLDGAKLRAATSATAPATPDWTPSAWTSDGRVLTTTAPLDDETGTGALDARRALIQHAGGEQGPKSVNPAGIGPIGWFRGSLTMGTEDIFEFNFDIPKGAFITTTLVWDRPIVENDKGVAGSCTGGPPAAGCGVGDDTDTFTYGATPNFDLFIVKNAEELGRSISGGTTSEHLHYPVPEPGNAFEYKLKVALLGAGTTAIDYAIAWWTVPEPGTLLLMVIGLCAACRRRGDRVGVWVVSWFASPRRLAI